MLSTYMGAGDGQEAILAEPPSNVPWRWESGRCLSPAVGSRGLWSVTREEGEERLARPQGCEWPTTSPGDVRQGERLIHRPGCKLLYCSIRLHSHKSKGKTVKSFRTVATGHSTQALALLSTEAWRIILIPCS